MLPSLLCALQPLLEQQDWTTVIGVMGVTEQEIPHEQKTMTATLRPTGGLQARPLPHVSALPTCMYGWMDRKCVSAAVTTVGTPTETSDNIITIPNHSTLLQ